MSDIQRSLGIAAAFGAGITWGFLGLFVRGIYDGGISPMQLTCVRCIIVSVILGAYLFVFHRDALRIDRRTVAMILFLGIFGLALNSTLYFEAITRISLSLSTVLQYIAPFIVVMASVFLFGERMTARKGVAIITAFSGCILCTGVLTDAGSMNAMGIAMALLSGVFFAAYALGSKDLSRHGVSPTVILFYASVVCSLFLMPISDMPRIAGILSSSDDMLLLVIGTGILMTLLPFGLYNYAIDKIDVGMVSIITYVEPLAATIVGFVFYSEAVTVDAVVGIAVILVAVVLLNHSGRARRDASG